MKIAVVGGGAAGVASAYLLSSKHDVTLYEKAPMLGGHIRTVGRNAPCDAVDPDRPLEAGVLEFDRRGFHWFRALMAHLDVELRPVAIYTSVQGPGISLQSLGLIGASHQSLRWKVGALRRLLAVGLPRQRFRHRADHTPSSVLRDQTMASWLPAGPMGPWMRALLTYAYSAPYDETIDFPAELGVPVLRHFMGEGLDWVRIVGGVCTWIEQAMARCTVDLRLGAAVDAIHRRDDGVTVQADGMSSHYDAIVIATSPGQIMRVLADPDQDELRRFGAWTDHDICTLIHRDQRFFEREGIVYPTAFDLFVDGETGGYNALLNHICGYPRHAGPRYSMALDIDHLIDPAAVIHRQPHVAPRYTQPAFRYRHEVIAHNGHRNTWIAGAWLGDGLHEGAISSAVNVSRALGGRDLEWVPPPD